VSSLTLTQFGIGAWGARIARILVSRGIGLDIVDTDPARERTALNAGARSFTTRPEVAVDSRGIIIATPSTTHYSLIRDLVRFGLPMFVEKPLTTNVQQARDLAAYKDDAVFVMHTWLYHPGIRLIADIHRSGVLGELLYLRTQRVNWTSPRKDTDTCWNLLPHDLTTARAILGHYPEAKYAVAEVHENVPRGLVCIMGDSPHVMTEVSNRFWQRGREVRAHFTGGSVSLPDEKTPYLEVVQGDHRTESDGARVSRKSFSLDPDPLTVELLSFLEYLEGGPPPDSSLEEGIAVVERIAAIRRLAGLAD
jgi:predicted dehydrogenase